MRTYNVKQAANFCNRSIPSIRLWIKTGKLVAKRSSSKGNAPFIIQHEDLMKAMHSAGLLEQKIDNKVLTPDEIITSNEGTNELLISTSIGTSDSKVEYLERLLKTVESERDRLLKEIEKLQQKLDNEIEYSRGLAERIAALEREVVSIGGTGRGILGYLGKGIKRLMEKVDTRY